MTFQTGTYTHECIFCKKEIVSYKPALLSILAHVKLLQFLMILENLVYGCISASQLQLVDI